jgi:hypothetical protein
MFTHSSPQVFLPEFLQTSDAEPELLLTLFVKNSSVRCQRQLQFWKPGFHPLKRGGSGEPGLNRILLLLNALPCGSDLADLEPAPRRWRRLLMLRRL